MRSRIERGRAAWRTVPGDCKPRMRPVAATASSPQP